MRSTKAQRLKAKSEVEVEMVVCLLVRIFSVIASVLCDEVICLIVMSDE